jgi:hypothetical protein
VSADTVQDNFTVEGYGTFTYPAGTRILRVVVPPGIVFVPPSDVLVEDITEGT